MMNSKRIAQKWATEHPTATALLRIVTDGRSGYGEYIHEWYAHNGQVARKDICSVYDTLNGVCAICGRLFLDAVLKRAWAPDPDAGQPLPADETQPWLVGRVFRAQWGSVIACPACVTAHRLDTRAGYFQQGPIRSGWIGDQYHIARPHPTLNHCAQSLPVVRIDERPAPARQRRAPRPLRSSQEAAA